MGRVLKQVVSRQRQKPPKGRCPIVDTAFIDDLVAKGIPGGASMASAFWILLLFHSSRCVYCSVLLACCPFLKWSVTQIEYADRGCPQQSWSCGRNEWLLECTFRWPEVEHGMPLIVASCYNSYRGDRVIMKFKRSCQFFPSTVFGEDSKHKQYVLSGCSPPQSWWH